MAEQETHAVLDPVLCPACNDVLIDGCSQLHEHQAWGCYGIADMRQLDCGCYVHKECQKSGEKCQIHAGTTVTVTAWQHGVLNPDGSWTVEDG